MTGEHTASLRAPLDAALGEELERLELMITRVWVFFFAACVVGALVYALTVSRPLGIAAAGGAAVLLAWFAVVHELMRRGIAPRALPAISTVVEGAIPWVSLWLEVYVRGAAYALGSWVAPMLYGALILAATVRLRPNAPLLIGLSSGAAFAALYFVLVRPELSPALAAQPLYKAGTQISRAVSFACGGAVGSLVARGLRRVIGRAESTVRSQELFGKYRLLRPIASGGMGTVHEALYCPEGGFERPVAIKRIHPHLAEQESFVQGFRTEAELAARLVHRNIVQVLDFGRIENTFFLAMEFVDGLTLGSFMRRMALAGRTLPPWLVAHIGREILAGLDYSHEGALGSDGRPMHIVHRDLGPANVLLSRNGEVKISDFGLARALHDAESSRTRTVAGNVGYMAPEQATAQPFDQRCDLFGLGVILWELLAGRRLFQRGNEAATLFALVNDPVPLIVELRPELDAAWDEVIGRALARDPAERYASAAEMAAALDRAHFAGGRRDVEALAQLVDEALALPERADTSSSTNEDATRRMSPAELAESQGDSA